MDWKNLHLTNELIVWLIACKASDKLLSQPRRIRYCGGGRETTVEG